MRPSQLRVPESTETATRPWSSMAFEAVHRLLHLNRRAVVSLVAVRCGQYGNVFRYGGCGRTERAGRIAGGRSVTTFTFPANHLAGGVLVGVRALQRGELLREALG